MLNLLDVNVAVNITPANFCRLSKLFSLCSLRKGRKFERVEVCEQSLNTEKDTLKTNTLFTGGVTSSQLHISQYKENCFYVRLSGNEFFLSHSMEAGLCEDKLYYILLSTVK